MKTLQQAFDRMANHMLHIRSQSNVLYDEGSFCAYRSKFNCCAVGVLIDDEHYSSDLEGASVDNERFKTDLLIKSGYPSDYRAMGLYSEFQILHDFTMITGSRKSWFGMGSGEKLEQLKKIADKFELTCFDEVPEPLTDLPACVDYERQGEREQ